MRVLVTGGAGFLGSHLCRALLGRGHQVLAMDNLLTGRMETLHDLLDHKGFSFRKWDVSLPYEAEVDIIFNMASAASPPKYQIDPVHTLRTNVLGADHALRVAQTCGAVMIQASTSEIYGDPDCHPQPESYIGQIDPLSPRACYNEGKRAAETLCFDYHRRHGVRVKIMRLFNTYGPAMDIEDGRVVTNFLAAALRDAPLQLHGDGSQTRSFCYVSDTIAGMLALMDSDDTQTGPYNIGNPGEITVRALAEQIKALTGSDSPVVSGPAATDDPRRRCPDITRAKAELNWAPSVPLADGLRNTLDDIRARLAARAAQGTAG
ncbi:UDP-glucuronic acid decarboxylase family protein [Dinoroseobacter sp. S375]|uniref:UDP-glucuronic acid decarboxylase family protein n=1 Tax=Dinoroseobacter sp. S375 TaxID=3415136 RepID=UPI003C7A2184